MFARDISKKVLKDSSAFYLYGDDIYWIEYARDFFINLISTENRDINIKTYDNLDSLAEIIFTLSSFGFNDEKQIIFVQDNKYKTNRDELNVLLQLLEEGIEPYILVFENVSFLTSQAKKVITSINCNKLDRFSLVPIIEARFQPPHHDGIDRRASYLLLDYTNNEMARVDLECQKLLEYSAGQRITPKMIELLVTEDAEIQIYHFINCIVANNKDKAIMYLNRLLKKGQRRSYILASLINQYRRILHSAISPKSDAELAKIFKVKEYAIIKARQVHNLSVIKLKETLDMLVDYEYKFKSGIMNESMAFDTAMSKLLSA